MSKSCELVKLGQGSGLFETRCILCHFWDKAWYWSNIAFFSDNPCIRRRLQRVPSKYCQKVGHGKTRTV